MRYLLLLIPVAAIIWLFRGSTPEAPVKEGEGVTFYNGSWKGALQQAQREKKLIFLDVYASWCGPCKMLKRKTFANKDVGQYYNEHFINVSLDGEAGEGIELSNKLGVNSYPSLYFIDSNGNVVYQTGGYYPAGDFLELGKTVVTGKGR
jgi:thioredoxin 1